MKFNLFSSNNKQEFHNDCETPSFSGSNDDRVETYGKSDVKQHPILKSINDLRGRYQPTNKGGVSVIRFGRNNEFPEIIKRLSTLSSTHRGILGRKAQWIHGIDLTYNKASIPAGRKLEFEFVFDGVKGDSLKKVVKMAARDYEHQEAFAFIVKTKNSGRAIDYIKHVDVAEVRAVMPSQYGGEVTRYAISNWNDYSFPIKVLPKYDPMNSTDKEQLVYYIGAESDNKFYGVPSYLAATYFIESEREFGRYIKDSGENGFNPTLIATFVGRGYTEEQKKESSRKFISKFTGDGAVRVITQFIRRNEEKPQYDTIAPQGLDKTFREFADLDDSKILTAHKATSPALFGVQVSGKLGGNGSELTEAWRIFRANETLPRRADILGELQRVFKAVRLNVELEVVEAAIDPVFDNPNGMKDKAGDVRSPRSNGAERSVPNNKGFENK